MNTTGQNTRLKTTPPLIHSDYYIVAVPFKNVALVVPNYTSIVQLYKGVQKCTPDQFIHDYLFLWLQLRPVKRKFLVNHLYHPRGSERNLIFRK